MEQWLSDILKNPQSGNGFKYDETGNLLIDPSNEQSYPVVHTIPVFIQKEGVSVTSGLHQNVNSIFNYIDHYEKDAEVFDYCAEQPNGSLRQEERWLRKQILYKLPKNAECILDVGCGSAWLSEALVPKGRKIISLDISLINTKKALEKTPGSNHAAIVADVYTLPFGENTIDCIVASEIMEHLYDPLLFIQKLLFILKPGGRLIISTPYNEAIEYSLCVHCNKPTPRNAHLHSFDEKKMKAMLQQFPSVRYQILLLNSKLLIKTRMHRLLSFTSARLWQFIDSMACKIFRQTFRMIIILDK